MAHPQLALFGATSLPLIVDVDDAWFEGTETEVSVELCLGGFENANGDLTELLSRLKNATNAPSMVHYLEKVVSVAIEAGTRLALCNFEYFEEHFDTFDVPNCAVLVDVAYGSNETYGVDLLHRLLRGCRPFADIFFFTAWPTKPSDVTSMHRDDPSWWPLRTIPVVVKQARVLDELRGFAKYFRQGIGNANLRLREHAVCLLAAINGNFSHPATFGNSGAESGKTMVPATFPVRSLFEPYGPLELSSFKALYHGIDSSTGEASRRCSIGIFFRFLKHAGFSVFLSASVPDLARSGTFRLPMEPGVIFLMHLIQFLQQADASSVDLCIEQVGYGCRAVLRIPACGGIRSALANSTGRTSTGHLQALAACKADILRDVGGDRLADIVERLPVGHIARPTSPSRYTLGNLQLSFDGDDAVLTWEFDCD